MAFATPIMKTAELIAPYGGQLVNLLVDDEEKQELREYAAHLHSIQLSTRTLCDLELLAVGAFSPLDRFMGKRDYKCVLNESRLTNGCTFPIPVTLPVEPTPEISLGREIALRDLENNLLAVMTIHEIYGWNLEHEARWVYGTTDLRHPLISEMHRLGKVNISGPLRVLQLPVHHDFPELRLTPAQTRARLQTLGHTNVVALQTRNPLQRAHEKVIERVVQEINGSLLLHSVAGMPKSGDIDLYMRVCSYRALTERTYDPTRVTLAALPLAMRMAGPREAVWHMIIQRNYGANHLIVGRDHASPGNDSTGKPFYRPYIAQEIAELYSSELGVNIVPFGQFEHLDNEEQDAIDDSALTSLLGSLFECG
jgi:sulfate adenylyltransferase